MGRREYRLDPDRVVCGALTATMLLPMITPRFAFKHRFDEVPEGALGELLMRNWVQMIFATGLLLIYAADSADPWASAARW